jgi:hypothetical protein
LTAAANVTVSCTNDTCFCVEARNSSQITSAYWGQRATSQGKRFQDLVGGNASRMDADVAVARISEIGVLESVELDNETID